MKIVDTQQYVSILREPVKEGKTVSLVVAGSSMTPFLVHQRDVVWFEAPNRRLRRGDIVFYQRDNGQFVMHRIYKIKSDGYYIVGDAQMDIEGPIRENQIFALITSVKRKGKMLDEHALIWQLFSKVWIRLVPLRHKILALYTLFFKKKTRI